MDIWERIVAACTPESMEEKYSHNGEDDKKSYTWRQEGNTIRIDGFTEYGTLTIEGTKLLTGKGKNEDNEPLVFEVE